MLDVFLGSEAPGEAHPGQSRRDRPARPAQHCTGQGRADDLHRSGPEPLDIRAQARVVHQHRAAGPTYDAIDAAQHQIHEKARHRCPVQTRQLLEVGVKRRDQRRAVTARFADAEQAEKPGRDHHHHGRAQPGAGGANPAQRRHDQALGIVPGHRHGQQRPLAVEPGLKHGKRFDVFAQLGQKIAIVGPGAVALGKRIGKKRHPDRRRGRLREAPGPLCPRCLRRRSCVAHPGRSGPGARGEARVHLSEFVHGVVSKPPVAGRVSRRTAGAVTALDGTGRLRRRATQSRIESRQHLVRVLAQILLLHNQRMASARAGPGIQCREPGPVAVAEQRHVIGIPRQAGKRRARAGEAR